MMPIPSYEALMLPLLKSLSDGRERSIADIRGSLAAQFGLSVEELAQTLIGGQPIFNNRVGWAGTYLKKAAVVDSPRRGCLVITQRGMSLLREHPEAVDNRLLSRFTEFAEFRNRRPQTEAPVNAVGHTVTVQPAVLVNQLSPEESLQQAYQSIMTSIADDILARVCECSPSFFERLVVQVLVKMGYGGTESDAARAVGRSGDGGIDGVIREDALGLDSIYVQAKRWDGTVGRPDIHQFVGALADKGARKGVFITTSSFSKEARQFVANLSSPRIALVDGAHLANLMLRYGVGVSTSETYIVKKVDTDFFVED
jgi:restriction system protein